MKTISLVVLAAVAIGLVLGSVAWCADANSKATTAPSAQSPYANTKCPIMQGSAIDPSKVSPDLTREYKGKKIAFCCSGCVVAWDKLSDEEKDKRLKEVGVK